MNRDKNDQTERILQGLDGLHKATAPDFFYTRLKARMEKELMNESKPMFFLRPAFLTTCLALLFGFNCITLVINNTNKQTPVKNKPATIESFASEYNLNTESVY